MLKIIKIMIAKVIIVDKISFHLLIKAFALSE